MDPKCNIFSLGLDSFLTLTFLKEINQTIGIKLTLNILMKYDTIHSLVTYIESLKHIQNIESEETSPKIENTIPKFPTHDLNTKKEEVFLPSFISPQAIIPSDVLLSINNSRNIHISPFVTIEDNVEINDGVYIHSFTAIKKGVSIGILLMNVLMFSLFV